MKKILSLGIMLLLVLSITGCDFLPEGALEATEEYCAANPDSTICQQIEEIDPEAVLANAAFTSMVNDYNAEDVVFNCELYFDDTLAALCVNEVAFFAPDKYESLEIDGLEDVVIEGSEMGYKFNVATEILPEYIEFTVGFNTVDTSLEINSWSYQLIPNPNYTEDEVTALYFIMDFNMATLDSTTVCNQWMNDIVDAAACAVVRATTIEQARQLEFVSLTVEGDYNIVEYKDSADDTYVQKYILYADEKFSYDVTDDFLAESVPFVSNFNSQDVTDADLCSLLADDAACLVDRAAYGLIGMDMITNDLIAPPVSVDGLLTYTYSFTLALADSTSVNLVLQAQLIEGALVYSLSEVTISN